jgi:hypothetical protein
MKERWNIKEAVFVRHRATRPWEGVEGHIVCDGTFFDISLHDSLFVRWALECHDNWSNEGKVNVCILLIACLGSTSTAPTE